MVRRNKKEKTVTRPLYRFEVFDQSGAICYQVESWRMLPPDFFATFIDLGDFPRLRGVRIHGQAEDGWLYGLYGGSEYNSKNCWWRLEVSKKRKGIELVGGTDGKA
jgi:hypothetical protein